MGWRYWGTKCENGCCNPDNDAGGNWCFTDRSCRERHGTRWGYCEESSGYYVPASGCACKSNWQFNGETCIDGCCNPDGDTGGDWCFVEEDCGSSNWGYCRPINKFEAEKSF